MILLLFLFIFYYFNFYLVHAHSAYSKGYVFRLSVLLLAGWGGGWVSGKMHYEHILATKVLMPVGCGGGGV